MSGRIREEQEDETKRSNVGESNGHQLFLKQVAILIASGLLVKSYPIVNQAFITRISLEHLSAFAFASFGPMFFQIGGLSIGISLLTILGRRPAERKNLVGGALALGTVVGLVTALLLLPFGKFICRLLGILEVPGVLVAYPIICLSAIFISPNLILKYVITSDGKRAAALVWDFVAFALSSLFNWFVFNSPLEDSQKFVGIFIILLFVEVCTIGVYAFLLRGRISYSIWQIKPYLAYASSMIGGDALHVSALYLTPFLFSLIYGMSSDIEAIAAYNIGYSLHVLFYGLQMSVNFCGVVWLASSWSEKGNSIWDKKTDRIFWTALVVCALPVVLTLALLPYFFVPLYRLTSSNSLLIASYFLLAVLPWTLTVHYAAQLRVFEQSSFIAKSYIYPVYLIGLPASYIFVKFGYMKAAVFSGVLLPSIIRAVSLYLNRSRIDRYRRSSSRLRLDVGAIVLKNCRVNGVDLIEQRFVLQDISSGGCGVISSEVYWRVGDLVTGLICGHSHVVPMAGTIAHVTEMKTDYSKNRRIKSGIKFDNAIESLDQILGKIVTEEVRVRNQ